MHRIIVRNSTQIETIDESRQDEPLTWFEGIYSRNEIPFPILYNHERLISTKSGEVILDRGERFIEHNLSDIIRIEFHELGSTVFLTNKSFWTTSKPIDRFAEELNGCLFFRVHPKHLVNFRYMESFVRCDAFITLSTSEAIPVDSKSNITITKYLKDKQIL